MNLFRAAFDFELIKFVMNFAGFSSRFFKGFKSSGFFNTKNIFGSLPKKNFTSFMKKSSQKQYTLPNVLQYKNTKT